ncbi:periplasmic chaperone for outer membrane proteins Skp [Cribrihabitans marinus]|uniref:Periplasmic chaperone for outer membrane proteins Skp n=1 Tax=Cribrihabitans marinus TaxID=1227549 RepID=A0A1H6QIP7_9RHOB|nr:OmpH family outer membrane protein [Cribrihabitans marinus]GGH19049.1 hypothetical protein GCM10010973_02220 [Cribrihabitans marinus]SEI43618.1 periplasmic chaperone for outer membrane proteins Skp [Cribrihabitans marinus]
MRPGLLLTMGRARTLAFCILAAVWTAGPAPAQQTGVPQGEILTISADRLFSESLFGRRIADEVEAESAVLAAENERIIAALSREEAELTERRGTMQPEAFRALADAFDRKVQEHRSTQKAKLEALSERTEEAQSRFFVIAQPVLEALMKEAGAGVILERSSVFLSANATDITDLAIARIDATIGDGAALEERDDP